MGGSYDNKGKDDSPHNTVEKIKKILLETGIKTEHTYIENGVKNSFCSRLCIKGALSNFIGTNGKGITEEYCAASAYSEFIERVQNRAFALGLNPFNQDASAIKLNPHSKSYKVYNTADNIPQNDSYVKFIKESIEKDIKYPFLSKLILDELFSGDFAYFPFYNPIKKEYEELPALFCKYFTHSNGMAAGNTLEEAIVQAYSEIFERYAQSEIMTKFITPPDIPQNVIDRYPAVLKILDEIKEFNRYKVYLKDCSLNKGIPVTCCIIIDELNQSFGIRFGSHPNMGIALERTLTEAFQGRNPEGFTSTSTVAFDKRLVDNRVNTFGTKKTGNGFYPHEILLKTDSYPFNDWSYNESLDNRHLMLQLTEKFRELDVNVYIQDVSFLGFPTVYVVAEGIGEIRCCDLFHLKEIKLMMSVMSSLIHIDSIKDDQIREIIQLVKLKRSAVLENTINNFYKMPFDRSFYTMNELEFLMFACYYQLGDIDESIKILDDCHYPVEGGHQFLDAVKKYLHAKVEGLDDQTIAEVLLCLCTPEVVSRVIYIFSDHQQTLQKLYPVCNEFMCDSCPVDYCAYTEIAEFDKKIWEKLNNWTGAKEQLHLIFTS